MVPCDPVEYLNTEYGENSWKTPKKSLVFNTNDLRKSKKEVVSDNDKYNWPNLLYYGKYDNSIFLKTARFYLRNGLIDIGTTLGYLSSLFNVYGRSNVKKLLESENERFKNENQYYKASQNK